MSDDSDAGSGRPVSPEAVTRAARALHDGDVGPADALLAEGSLTLQSLAHDLRVYQAELDAQSEQLRDANERLERLVLQFRNLFEALPQPALVVDALGQIVRANGCAEQLFGLELATSTPRRALRHLCTELAVRTQLSGALAEAAAEGRARCPGVALRDRHGSTHRVDLFFERHEAAPDGRRQLFIVLLVDETDRIAAAERLAAANDALRQQQRDNRTLAAVARSTQTMVITTDAARRITWVNEGFERCTGYRLQDVVDRKPSFLQGPGTSPATLALMHERLESGRGFSDVEVLNYDAQGRPYWVLLDVQPIFDETGRVEGFVSVQVNVTERRRTEARVREAEAFQRAVLDTLPAAVLTLHGDGRIHSSNAFGAELLQAAPDALAGLSLANCLEASCQGAFEQLLTRARSGRGGQMRTTLTGREGLATRVELRSSPMWLEGSVRHIVIVARDVSLEESLLELRAQKEAAEASNLAKTQFLSQMSHELRTPLNAIIGFTELALMDLDGSGDPEAATQRGRLEHVERAGWHLLSMVNDVLDLSRVESGNLQVVLDRVSVRDALVEAVAQFEAPARRAGVQLALAAPPRDCQVRADAHRLQQVLANLLSNAIKYNRPGGHVTVSADCSEPLVRIAVTDDGPGLTPAQRERLFTPFDRLGAPSSIEGTGIGLTITRHLAELMGGRLEVESEPGRGSRFVVVLPPDLCSGIDAAPPSAAGPQGGSPSTSPPAPGEPAAAAALHVLYIEDSESNIALLADACSGPRWRLTVARSGTEGLAMARAEPPDVVLLDLQLPDLDGVEVRRRLAAAPETAHIPCIAATADLTRRAQDGGPGGPFQAWLDKPLKLAEVRALLQATVTGAGSGGSARA